MVFGENLARIRTARGYTQEALAQQSGVSVDTISRLERGTHEHARRSTLQALASTLGIDTARLLGMNPPEQDAAGAEQLRRAVNALEIGEQAEPDDVPELPELHDAASTAWSDYLGGRHTELLAGLPVLMTDTRRAVSVLVDDYRAEAAGLLANAYRLTAGLAGRIGLVDLAAHAAHRALDTARHTTRPDLDEAAALRYLAWTFVRQGDLTGAERLALNAAARLDGGMMARPDPDKVAVFGGLLMNAASAAAREGRSDAADDHLAIARAAAARSGRDTAAETGVFGPRVAGLQMVDQAVRTGRPDEALELARRVPDPVGPAPVPPFWEAGHRIHLAAACADLGQWTEALDHLVEASQIAPEWSRLQPLGRTVAAQIVDHRRRGEKLALVADHYGAA